MERVENVTSFKTGLICAIFLSFLNFEAPAWQNNPRTLTIKEATSEIEVDGVGDEEAWELADVANNFHNQYPSDSGQAVFQTEVKLLFDNQNIYVLAVLHDKGERVVSSLKRDRGTWDSDLFNVILDPVGSKTTGFVFGVNSGGSQNDADIVMRGSSPDDNQNWDNKWFSKVKKYDDRWVVEMAIPFKAIRFNAANRTWGINFERRDMNNNVTSVWSPVPFQFGSFDLGYTAKLEWESLPKVSKGNIVLIPYLSHRLNKDFQANERAGHDFNTGLDAKIAVTSSLNLDFTVNPDFSNVDVDRQVTNLSRFSLFFPERRNFFLENSSLFSNFGSRSVRPFFSRRIGLGSRINYGARLTGNVLENTRIGLMRVETDESGGTPGQAFSIASFEQRLLSRSSIKGFLLNKHNRGEASSEFNNVMGIELDYVSKTGTLTGSFKGHLTETEDRLNENSYLRMSAGYNGRRLDLGFSIDRLGENYIAETGFVPRLNHYDALNDQLVRIGYNEYRLRSGYTIISKSDFINTHNVSWSGARAERVTGGLLQQDMNLRYEIEFQNTANASIGIRRDEVALPFETSLISDELLPIGSYNFNSLNIEYQTDNRTPFNGSVFVDYGGFYNGKRFTIGADLNYGPNNPWGNFSISYEYNEVTLPEQFGKESLHLIGPRAEIYFSSLMSWTTYIQYNTQNENLNVNSRFQWRFKPMSDLFIVYTDNYATENLGIKNRGVVVKLTYWLNL